MVVELHSFSDHDHLLGLPHGLSHLSRHVFDHQKGRGLFVVVYRPPLAGYLADYLALALGLPYLYPTPARLSDAQNICPLFLVLDSRD